ncbi:hypothetical protein N9985_02990 [Gammaproteobacteria bacterium]|nr:hypothetical protein [Gammaproteobacteria bacterium]
MSQKTTLNDSNSTDLKGLQERISGSNLCDEDKSVVAEILEQTIKLKALIEAAEGGSGEKTVLASLPFGFDIVK